MDELLRREVNRIYERHRVPAAARAALDALLEAAFDDRLQFTQDLGATLAGPAAPVAEPPRTGFEDLGRLGLGGMGEVRRVRETALGRVVAMKILRDGVDRSWFDREVRLTASLDHPGVLPLFSTGVLPDGRPYFTLREAEGQTLREALDEPGGPGPRALLGALRRVAETVASAHVRGVVHRDLKPENILLGAFGAVWVLDWGIAGPAGEVLATVAGSPRYMAPEQLRRQAIGPEADVWALGVLLYEILTGHLAFPGDASASVEAVLRGAPAPGPTMDPSLAALYTRATAADPAQRLPDAAAFAEALGRWLDGAAAREEALAVLARAEACFTRARERRASAAQLESEAAARLVDLPTWAPPEVKQAAWELENRSRDALLAAILDEEQAVDLAQQALQRSPELREAHQLLAAHYRARLEEAERVGDPVAPRLEARLRAHDTGEQARWLLGTGAVTLVTDPPGARVRAARYEPFGRRLVAGEFHELGSTPLLQVPLGRGSWILEISAPGHHTVRYPVLLDRTGHWDGRPPGAEAPWPIWLPPLGALGPEDVYVPAGWTQVGGDPRAVNQLPAGRVWVDSFVVRRYAFTHGEYLAYVNARVEEEGFEATRPMVPLGRYADPAGRDDATYRWDGERWSLDIDLNVFGARGWSPDHPVVLLSYDQVLACAAWHAARSGLPWRMLTDLEFEKAARGVDGRFYPWGNGFDHSFSCIRGSYPEGPRFGPVHDFPVDESPYGVRGLAGGARAYVGAPDAAGELSSRGGYWNAAGHTSRSASRFFSTRLDRSAVLGMRLARDLGPRYRS